MQRIAELDQANSELTACKDMQQRIVSTQRTVIEYLEQDLAESREGHPSTSLESAVDAALIAAPPSVSSIMELYSPYLDPLSPVEAPALSHGTKRAADTGTADIEAERSPKRQNIGSRV